MIKDFSSHNPRSKIRIKKDYRRKNFTNPYFNNAQKKESAGFNTILYLKIILAVFLIYVVAYSDLFKIKTVSVNGAQLINQSELEQIINQELNSWRWLILPQKNLLFMSRTKIIEAISQKYGLDNIEIKRGWQKITINIKEKINYLIVSGQDKLFFADKQGMIIREIPPDETDKYLNQFPRLNLTKEIKINEEAVSAPLVDFIMNLDAKIKALGLAVENYESGGQTEITLVTKAGWRAHFDINNDLSTSIENMQMVLNNKIKEQNKIEYIDLRFGDKIYYK